MGRLGTRLHTQCVLVFSSNHLLGSFNGDTSLTAAAPVGDNDIIDPSMQVGLPNSNTNDLKKVSGIYTLQR